MNFAVRENGCFVFSKLDDCYELSNFGHMVKIEFSLSETGWIFRRIGSMQQTILMNRCPVCDSKISSKMIFFAFTEFSTENGPR